MFRLGPPLHHGGGTDPDANVVQKFVDSDAGTLIGTFLHTTGALLFTAGIILYLYQARLIHNAKRAESMPSLKVLPIAHGFNLIGIAFNGMGGLMRLYQSDHPGIDQFATSTWVQVLVVKHLFLVAGVALAVFLTFRTHMLAIADEAPMNFFPETRRIQWMAAGSFVTILMASVLGAAATTSPLPGADVPPVSGTMDGTDHEGHAAATVLHYSNTTGSITGSPLSPGRNSHTMGVPTNSSELWAELSWSNTRIALDLALVDPEGKGATAKRASGPGRVSLTLEKPGAGSWTFVVSTTGAVDEKYLLVGRVTEGNVPQAMEETCTVNPRTGFAEINLTMKTGKSMNWTWYVVDSSEKLDFNIHLHIGGQVTYPVRGQWNRHNGTYMHSNTQTEGVSLMWENPNAGVLRVHYRVEGEFAFHSRAGC